MAVYKNITKLSIVVPCYNESATVEEIIDEVLSVDINGIKKEIIIVDDGSKDDTPKILEKIAAAHKEVKIVLKDKNSGKSDSLKQGIKETTGDLVIIQDADREYDPRDYGRMLKLFSEDRADIVFGSRFSGGSARRIVYLQNTIANKLMSRMSAFFSGLYVSDIHTCYIMFRGEWIRERADTLKSMRFGFNPEVVAMVAREKSTLKVCEVGISYYGRSKEEGKKIGYVDGFKALWEIVYYNLFAKY